MKLSSFILMITILNVGATVYSQTTRLNTQLKDATVKEVFQNIEDQSEFRFFYSDDLNYINKRVNINATNKTVEKILDEVLENSDLTYKILENNLIIIVPANMLKQGIRVSGVVRDENGEPLPGVNVVVKGMPAVGVVTDVNGKYTVNVANEQTVLVFSFIGLASQEISVGNQRTIDITLLEDATQLETVVVTAFGMRRELKTLGYAISSISAKELTLSGTTNNPMQSLYGKAAGVTLRQSASGPLGGIDFKVRGSMGLDPNAKNRPLFVIDGTPIYDTESGFGFKDRTFDYGSGINDLNSEDIESIDILKGAKATVLYGSQGANGVVLITTKNGKNRKGVGVDFSYQTTIEKPVSYIDFQNTYGPGSSIYSARTTKVLNGTTYNQNINATRNFGPRFNENEKILWYDDVVRPYIAEGTGIANGKSDAFMSNYQTGYSNQATVAIAGSGGFGNARLGYTYYDYKGIDPGTKQTRNTISFGSTLVPSKWISVDVNSSLIFAKTYNRPQQAPNMVQGYQRDIPYLDFQPHYRVTDPSDPNYGYKTNLETIGWPSSGYNELRFYLNNFWNRAMNEYLDDKFHLISSVRPTITFTEGLYLVAFAGIDYTGVDYNNHERVTQVYPSMVGGKYNLRRDKMKVEQYYSFLNYEKGFVDNRFKLHVYGGPIYRSEYTDYLSVGTYGNMLYPDWYQLGNQDPSNWPTSVHGDVRNGHVEKSRMYSLLGTATLSWDDTYYLELNGRNDWSSTLPPENNSYFYPGAAFTWIMTRQLSNVPQLQLARLYTSFADVGREAPGDYFAYQGLSAGKINGTEALNVSSQSQLFAGRLKPERKREFEIGFNATFFQHSRLNIDFSFYTNNVYDQIMSVSLPPSSGADGIKINAGNVHNWGYELQLRGTPVLTKDFRWNITFNTANQYSKVKKLYTGITQYNMYGINGQVYAQARIDERAGNIYGHAIVTAPNGQRIVAPNGANYVLDDKNRTKIGNIFPNFIGGVLMDFNYKGFTLNATLDYKFGATLFSWTNYWMLYNGISMDSMEYRDEENGGMAYYVDKDNKKVALQHNQSAPADSKDGLVYHDGLILKGVVENGAGGYDENKTIVSATDYYSQFARWTNEAMPAQDRKFKNDYIKLRELGLTYNVPHQISQKLHLQNLRVTLFARNLWCLYNTLPNLDPESSMGTGSYIEFSPNPTQRTFGLNIGIGF